MNLIKLCDAILMRNRPVYKPAMRFYKDLAFEDIPEVSTPLIKKTLSANGISFEEGHTCFISKCNLFNNCNTDDKAKLYINKTTGFYMCSLCKHSGQWGQFAASLSLRKAKKSEAKKKNDNDFSELRELNESLEIITQSTQELKSFDNVGFVNIFNKFKLPIIAHSLLESLDIRINSEQTILYFPLRNVENEIVGYRTLNSSTHQESTLPNIQYGGLLMFRPIRSRDTAILVPTISDFLVLSNSKLSASIVCLPNGVNTLSQYVLPSLEKFKKIILWLGSDNKAWDSSRNFARKLGEKRCSLIKPSEQLPHLQNVQDFKAIIAGSHVMWHKSITTFGTLRAEVLSDLQNIDKVQGVRWKRFPTLSKILMGHRRGELTVLTGSTGCGKTTFVSEYSLDLAMQGVSTLWGSFEIRNARLARTMLQQMAGIPLGENLHLFDQLADEFQKLPIYFMTFHGQQTIKIVMEAVEHATYIHDIAHVIIDNVQFMMGISEEQKHMDRFWKQDTIIAAFRTFATRMNCHVTLVIHPRKERDDEDLTTSSIFGGAKASQEADNVLIIQDRRLTAIKGKKYLQVVKNRYSGDLGIMTLEFNKKALSYAQKKPKEKAIETRPEVSEFEETS
ncbi:mitochondrial DNA helicase isoform X1 [Dendroctonus ponderosae]|nr:mitochondrial DNA helicase isoform X1 [Dendroctonus ponderosae]